MPSSKMEFPKTPISSSPTLNTKMTQAIQKHDMMSYLVLDPPNNVVFRRWLGFGLNFKYFNYLREIDTSKQGPIEKNTWVKALSWLQTMRSDLAKEIGNDCNEYVKEDAEAAVGRFMGRAVYEKGETKLGFDGVVGSIVFHWCQELHEFEDGCTNTDVRDSWAHAFKDWNSEHATDGKTLPSEFQVLDLDPDEIPLGVRSERAPLKRENEFEVYNRLFWQYFYLRKNVMPKSKWPAFWVVSPRDLGESLQEDFEEVGDYIDCPCKFYFVVDEEAEKHKLEDGFLESKAKTGKLQLNSLARCKHPGAFPNLGHWRQTIRDQANLSDYGFDFRSIEMEWYTQEPGPETSPVDERLILGKG
ncbi:hypothetical protein KC330_g4747 [Hortaea werneckii]|nr:hypothetical protein KC330_g4747 [Hortaea werneckii]